MDLDYSKGYANPDAAINMDHYDMWQKYDLNLLNDMRIINESARKLDINIINTAKSAWHKVFQKGDLDENLVCDTSKKKLKRNTT